jgi:hypothetical protein
MSTKYILFTWYRCPQCLSLKRDIDLSPYRGNIYQYDVSEIEANSKLMGLFKRVSPNGEVPVAVSFEDGKARSVHKGVSNIKAII